MEYLIIKNSDVLTYILLFLLGLIIGKNFMSIKNQRKEFFYNSLEYVFNSLLLIISIYLAISKIPTHPIWLTLIVINLTVSTGVNLYYSYFNRGDRLKYQNINLAQLLFNLLMRNILVNIYLVILILFLGMYFIYALLSLFLKEIKSLGEASNWYQYLALYLFSFLIINLMNLKSYVLNLALPLLFSFFIILISKLISDNIEKKLKKDWQKIRSVALIAAYKILK